AFAHESGIHQDGVLKKATTYEIMTPESVGLNTNRMVLGKHSGRHAFKDHLSTLGYELDDEQLHRTFVRFKALADKKGEIFDEDLEVLVEDEVVRMDDRYHLRRLHVSSGTHVAAERGESVRPDADTQDSPVAAVELDIDGEVTPSASWGNGSVETVFKAISKVIPDAETAVLKRYEVKAVTSGIDSQAEVTVLMEREERTVIGRGSDYDVIIASSKAFVNALNKLAIKRGRSRSGV
ncbi:MAG: 2-isopropylmalate synthase, partial [Magnetococcales bacterium]|nr:2-isopropylmalate synthase [Magnetococcales bacterium]